MLEKLDSLEAEFNEVSQQLGAPETVRSPELYQKIARAHSELSPVVEKYREYKRGLAEIKGLKEMLAGDDAELVGMARDELQNLEAQIHDFEEELRLMLLPKDPNDGKNVILEIRAGTGGDEATLFAQEMFRMYGKYAETQGWRMGVVSSHHSAVGGLKEISATIEGECAYSRLKYESGVHRVQRVPETETQGRVHTSAVTVVILPEANEVDVKIQPKDLRVDTYCSSGPGGQSVNTTYSAVRITHIPTGEVATCQDEKSQIKNKDKALKVLRARLYHRAQREQREEIAATRRSLVGSGDRSEKIRTYNFPQNRVTDHRVAVTSHRLGTVMEGEIAEILDALIAFDQAEALKTEKIG